MYRSSHRRFFVKKVLLKISQISRISQENTNENTFEIKNLKPETQFKYLSINSTKSSATKEMQLIENYFQTWIRKCLAKCKLHPSSLLNQIP